MTGGPDARERQPVLIEVVVGVAIVVAILASVRILPEHRRLAVVRLGRYAGMRGPGVVLLLPLLDKAVTIDLPRDVPSWRSMSPEELAREVERLSRTGGLGL
jgi:regulator of protease activity HflC (stomatin/prohibitin superfamily)